MLWDIETAGRSKDPRMSDLELLASCGEAESRVMPYSFQSMLTYHDAPGLLSTKELAFQPARHLSRQVWGIS